MQFGESFEVVARTLADNAGERSTDALSALYAAHAAGNAGTGVNVESGGPVDAVAEDIVDLLCVKRNAIRLAADAAITVLRVDQIIMAKAAGGPKPPKPGHPDDD